jgi:hypothetical protein
MADQADVERQFVTFLSQVLYPEGTANPSIVVNATPVYVRRGWPDPNNLRNDLAAGRAYVTVYSRSGAETNVTSYPQEFRELSRRVKTITAAVNDRVITLSGSVSLPQNIHVRGPGVSVGYSLIPGDTLTSIATALSALLSEAYPGTVSSGPSLTVAGNPGDLTVLAGIDGLVYKEVKRQSKSFQITTWASTPKIRDSVAKTIDAPLAEVNFLTFADGDQGWVSYEITMTTDEPEEEGLWRRDLFYRVEYATLIIRPATEIVGVTVYATGAQYEAQRPADPPPPTRVINR